MRDFLEKLLQSEPFVFLKGAIVFLIGPINQQLACLGIVMLVDLILGAMAAVRMRVFKWSTLLAKVKTKFIIYTLWITAFHAFDKVAGMSGTARLAVIILLTASEILSAIKNTAKSGHRELAESLLSSFRSLISPPSLPTLDEDDEQGKRGSSRR